MAKNKTSFKKGEGGRPKGVPNRTTQESRELLEQILFGQIDNIEQALAKLKKDSDPRYIDAVTKLFQFVLPKKTDVTTGGEKIKQTLNVTVDTSDTGKTLEKLRDGSTD